jgi:phenylalanyl-tRNA synthetase alpha chain
MSDDLQALRAETEAALAAAADLRALDAVRVAVLGKSGSLSGLLKGLGAVPADQRKERGAALNRLKAEVEALLDARRTALEAEALDARLRNERADVSLPPRPFAPGAAADGGIHPISRTVEELTAIFGAMGFKVVEGPDIESDWHNFGALNIPDHHPARQDHDTFYLPGTMPNGHRTVLRTHTSPVQIRTMTAQEPPIVHQQRVPPTTAR